MNNKRVRRLWRDEGLQVPTKKRKKRLTGIGAHVGAMCLIAPNALWALDFQFDHTIDGRQVKMLNVIDEFTRECPRHPSSTTPSTADDVVAVLDRLAVERGRAPAFVRFDNGPEFVADRRGRVVPRSTAPTRCSSTPARHGRTPGSSRSTAGSATSCSTCWQFDSLLEAQVLIGTGASTTTTTDPTQPTATSPPPSSPSLDHQPHQPTPSRIAAGPLIGAPMPTTVSQGSVRNLDHGMGRRGRIIPAC